MRMVQTATVLPVSVPIVAPSQAGLTLIELLLAMALGLGVILTALALLNSVRNGYLAIHDHALIQDNARYAQEVITQTLRQANFVPRDDATFAALDLSHLPPGLSGLDNSRLKENSEALSAALDNHANHQSDVLAVRYVGNRDQGLLNCAGFPVSAPILTDADAAAVERQRGWSIFYVATSGSGVPELRCKFLTSKGRWDSVAITPNVEALQVLYGISGQDGITLSQFLPARRMTPPQWQQVVAVRFSLLLRGEHNTAGQGAPFVYPMFGPLSQAEDIVTISDARQAGKLRQVFDMTVRLRNPAP